MDNVGWKNVADETPEYTPGLWSKDVICFTNLGDIYELAYCGHWQKPLQFLKGEFVKYWIEKPE